MRRRVRSALFLLCVIVMLNQLTISQTFNQKVYPSVLGAGTINRGDFNKDGILDVITGDGGLTVYFGKPDGTLQPGINTPAPPVLDMALGDFNRDGNIDVAIATFGPATGSAGQIQIMLGNGNGTFRSGQTLNLPSSATLGSIRSITSADFDGDGFLDLAVGADKVYFFAGHGDGTFTANVSVLPSGIVFLIGEVRVGDFDGDGRPDVALTDGTNIWILFSTGAWTFNTAEVFGPGLTLNPNGTGTNFTPTDVNQDGYTDLLISYDPCPEPPNPDKGVTVGCPAWEALLSNGPNRTFHKGGSFATSAGLPSFGEFYGLRAADIDGNGINDVIAISGEGVWEIHAWLGNPDGSYSQTPLLFPLGSSGTTDIIVGDFNRDGRPDFAVVNVGNGTLVTLLNALPRSGCNQLEAPMSVTICQPADYTYSNSPVDVIASATDPATVVATQVYVDNNLILQSSSSALNQLLSPLSLGDHLLVVKAWDAEGRSFFSPRHVSVFNGTPGEVCPAAQFSANLCLPSPSSSTGDLVRVLGAAQSQLTITAVQLYLDNVLVYNDTSLSTYVDTTISVSPGTHLLLLKAWDAGGANFTDTRTFTAQ